MNSIDVTDENKKIKKSKSIVGRIKVPLADIQNVQSNDASPSTPSPGTPKKEKSLDELMAGMTISPKTKAADVTISTTKKTKSTKKKQDKTVIVYEQIKSVLGPVGGDACGGPIYGELTYASFQKIVDYLENECELNNESIFVDVGSGLGKPNFHIASAAKNGIKLSIGIEVVGDRWIQSIHVLNRLIKSKNIDVSNVASKVFFAHADICHFSKIGLYGMTHMYSFNVGMPIPVKEAIVDTFMSTQTAEYLICFDKPSFILDYCPNLELIKQFSIHMHGSAEGHTVFFYRRKSNKIKSKIETYDILDIAKNIKLTTLSAIPTDPDFAMCSPHTSIYHKGLSYYAAGKASYLDWIEIQSSSNLNSHRMTRQSKRNIANNSNNQTSLKTNRQVNGNNVTKTTNY